MTGWQSANRPGDWGQWPLPRDDRAASLRAIVMSSEAETSLSIGFQCPAVIVRDSSTLLGMTEDPIRPVFEKAVGAFAARRKFCGVDALS